MIRILHRIEAIGLLAVLCLAAAGGTGLSAELMDMFADRQAVTNDSGQVLGSNTLATLELYEPQHGGKPGGHSVWLSWIAPANGIVTIETTGSTFDTLLGVYTLDPGTNRPPMQLLRSVAGDDDNGTNKTSLVQFGATSGTRYEIAVAGYQGATGNVQLSWNLLRSSQPPPIILNVPPDRALQAGDNLTLTVDYQASSSVKLLWFFNGVELTNDESATLVITNFQDDNVGRYQLRFTSSGIRFFTDPIEVQINSEGQTNALARDKLLDAEDSGLKDFEESGFAPARPGAKSASTSLATSSSAVGVVRGYNGTQIFNTSFATSDPGEPQHCNIPGGASYWFAYQAPTNGLARLNTDGSSFDTILAVYTYNPPLLGYDGLIPVTCDNNSGSNGLTSKVQFTADPARSYLVVVDGVNGARGVAYLNYSLTAQSPTNQTAPIIVQAPQSRAVAVGSSITFEVLAQGAGPMTYAWLKDSVALAGETNSSLTLTNIQPVQAGNYAVCLSNNFGAVTSAVAVLSVIVQPAITTQTLVQNVFAGEAAVFDVTATGTEPLHYVWNKDGAPITNVDAPTLVLSNVTVADAGNYVVEVVNAAGLAASVPVPLAVLGRPTASLDALSRNVTVSFAIAGPAIFAAEFTDQLTPPAWAPWTGPLTTNGDVVSLQCGLTNTTRFFRVHFQQINPTR